MTRIFVDHPLEEAEALLKRIGSEPLTSEEANLARAGRERLELAVKIERGASGSAEVRPTVEDARALIGQAVHIESLTWGEVDGRLKDVAEPALLIVETHRLHLTKRVPLGAVLSLDPAEDLAKAA